MLLAQRQMSSVGSAAAARTVKATDRAFESRPSCIAGPQTYEWPLMLGVHHSQDQDLIVSMIDS